MKKSQNLTKSSSPKRELAALLKKKPIISLGKTPRGSLLNFKNLTSTHLSIISACLFVGFVGISIDYIKITIKNNWLQEKISALNEEIGTLNNHVSAETNTRINELKKTEKTINKIEVYLQERGVHSTPVKTKATTMEPQSAIGQARRTANQPIYSSQYNTKITSILNAMKKVPLGVPHTGQISSQFGDRNNPFNSASRENHQGLDFKGSIGEPIRATANGVVVHAGITNGYGKMIKVKHSFKYETLYAHLSSVDVAVGQKIQAGEIIGKLGNTGRSTGPHLHYEVRLSGSPINPTDFLTL